MPASARRGSSPSRSPTAMASDACRWNGSAHTVGSATFLTRAAMALEGNCGALGKIGLALAGLMGVAAIDPACAQTPPLAPKVLVVTMFGGEAKPWLEGETLTRRIAVPGLAKAYPEIACTDGALCVMTTG